jgi:hypothetical protein
VDIVLEDVQAFDTLPDTVFTATGPVDGAPAAPAQPEQPAAAAATPASPPAP